MNKATSYNLILNCPSLHIHVYWLVKIHEQKDICRFLNRVKNNVKFHPLLPFIDIVQATLLGKLWKFREK